MSQSSNKTNAKGVRMFVVLGFASLGLLIGSIAGLSSADLTVTLLGLLFAFAGGSVIAFMGKMPKPSIILASIALSSFCLAAVMALYVGLFMKVNDLLFKSPKQIISAGKQSLQKTTPNDPVAQQAYRTLMRTKGESREKYLKDEVAFGRMTLFAACEQLSEGSLNEGKPLND